MSNLDGHLYEGDVSMVRFNGRIALTVAAVAALAVAGPLALAHGDAKSKNRSYESGADSSAGLNLLGILGGPELVGISNTEADSQTSDAGASSGSSARSLEVAGNAVGPTADCGATGADSQGVDKESDSQALVDQQVAGVDVKVLSASCDSRAVKSNNAHSSASASVAEVSAGELDVAVLSSSSDTKTTSGNARSGSSFAVASVNETTVLGCTAESRSTNGSQSDSAGPVLLDSPLAGVPCPAQSSSSHTRDP